MSSLTPSLLTLPAKTTRAHGWSVVQIISLMTLGTMFGLSRYAPDFFSRVSQEDQVVEWLTASLFLAAGGLILRHAIRTRQLFDGLVGVFCLMSAAEEVSWGQRLIGIDPPKYFLAANVQQEVSLHNLFSANAHDLIFAVAVLGYFVLLPVLARIRRFSNLGVTAPSYQLAPLAVVSVLLYTWDPVHMSTEWVELMVAGMFFSSSSTLPGTGRLKKITIGLAVLMISLGLASWNSRAADSQSQACARLEVGALLNDLRQGAATEKLHYLQGSVHSRMFAAESTGYLNAAHLTSFASKRCLDEQFNRQQYVIDPWGMSYWFFVEESQEGDHKLTVYSFGPNRRRDNEENSPGKTNLLSDDIAMSATLTRMASLKD